LDWICHFVVFVVYYSFSASIVDFQDSVIKILDALYRDRNYARFFVLETIARVPYFGKFYFLYHAYAFQISIC